MSAVELTRTLQHLTIKANASFPFKPSVEPSGSQKTLSEIPRRLFRIYTPCSDGKTDQCWAKSRDADLEKETATEDLFDDRDRYKIAAMINRHLRWCNKPDDSNTLVSWTSSLLFAIQYIFYRHTLEGTDLSEIMLCIVDTTLFNDGLFIRDMDLIDRYSSFSSSLRSLADLRRKKHKTYSGSYYFGEYLSQGALEIEGRCRTTSARKVVDNGLFTLQPEFEKSMKLPRCEWANEVIRLRDVLQTGKGEVGEEQILAAFRIGEIFGSDWRLPVVANLLTFLPIQEKVEDIAKTFRRLPSLGKLHSCDLLKTFPFRALL